MGSGASCRLTWIQSWLYWTNMRKIITLEAYKSAKGKNGATWAGNEFPKNTNTKTLWVCHKNHTWMAPYKEVVTVGTGCPYCYGYKTIEDYQSFARDGIRWKGTELPSNIKTKTDWKCPNGHIWQSTWGTVVGKKCGCPKCSHPNRKTEQDYQQVYETTGIKWAGSVLPKNVNAITSWQCPKGHIWESTYYSVFNCHSGCHHCPKSFAKTIKDYQEIKGKDGTRWIGTQLPKTVVHHTEWQCALGHTWHTSYKSIVLQKSGCPVCQQSIGEFAIKEILDRLNINFTPQKTFPSCRKRYVLPFDFYFALGDFEFLIEYDGLHHYRPIAFFGGEKDFQKRSANDRIKTQFAHDNGFILIRIPYDRFNDIEAIIKTEIEKRFDC